MTFIFWFIMFFGSKYFFPLPASLDRKLKPYDRMIVIHRIICTLHGVAAIFLSGYYAFFLRDFTCGKANTKYEVFVLCNTAGHFIADLLFMKLNGFLDIGNILHHSMAIVSYINIFYW
jgi:hypothetical protein